MGLREIIKENLRQLKEEPSKSEWARMQKTQSNIGKSDKVANKYGLSTTSTMGNWEVTLEFKKDWNQNETDSNDNTYTIDFKTNTQYKFTWDDDTEVLIHRGKFKTEEADLYIKPILGQTEIKRGKDYPLETYLNLIPKGGTTVKIRKTIQPSGLEIKVVNIVK